MASRPPEASSALLGALRKEYHHIKQVDDIFQQHRVRWLESLEQWMSHNEQVVRQLDAERQRLGSSPSRRLPGNATEPGEDDEDLINTTPLSEKGTIMRDGLDAESTRDSYPGNPGGGLFGGPRTPPRAQELAASRPANRPIKPVAAPSVAEVPMTAWDLSEFASDEVVPPLPPAHPRNVKSRGSNGATSNAGPSEGALNLLETFAEATHSHPSADKPSAQAVQVLGSRKEEDGGFDLDMVVDTRDSPRMVKATRAWADIVRAVLAVPKKLRQLKSVWVQSEQFLQKARKATPWTIDVFNGSAGHENGMLKEDASLSGLGPRKWSTRSPAIGGSKGGPPHIPRGLSTAFGAFAKKGPGSSAPLPLASRILDSSDDLDAEERPFSIIMEPTSTKRLGWVFLGMSLMLYDLIYFPLSAFDPPDTSATVVMRWTSQVYWTMDILMSFITGFHYNGEVILDFKKIAQVYIKTWFVFDILVTMPLWVIITLDMDSGNSQSIRSLRYFRMLRFLRLMRVAKFEYLLSEALEFVNSSTVILTFGIVKLMVYVMLLTHFNACLWFLVGNRENGWADDVTGHTAGRGIAYQYFCAMHWALTQFQGTSEILPGTTLQERMYAACYLLLALMILASFVGSLTNKMISLQSIKDERDRQQRQIRSYLNSNKVSTALSMRVKKYVEWKLMLVGGQQRDAEVLSILPSAMVVEILREVRGPTLNHFRFFELLDRFHQRIFRRVCYECVTSMWVAPDEVIFAMTDEARDMYFITKGRLEYTITPMVSKRAVLQKDLDSSHRHRHRDKDHHNGFKVSDGNWLCEAVLWVDWEHCGELVANTDAFLLPIHSEKFEKVVVAHAPAHASLVLYARRFLAALNIFGKIFTDYIPEGSIVQLEAV